MKPAAIKPNISPDDLARIGMIVMVDDVPGADKLMQLRVDFGDHPRTVVAGIKTERENPQEIVGRQALFVMNLPARKMRGVTRSNAL